MEFFSIFLFVITPFDIRYSFLIIWIIYLSKIFISFTGCWDIFFFRQTLYILYVFSCMFAENLWSFRVSIILFPFNFDMSV